MLPLDRQVVHAVRAGDGRLTDNGDRWAAGGDLLADAEVAGGQPVSVRVESTAAE